MTYPELGEAMNDWKPEEVLTVPEPEQKAVKTYPIGTKLTSFENGCVYYVVKSDSDFTNYNLSLKPEYRGINIHHFTKTSKIPDEFGIDLPTVGIPEPESVLNGQEGGDHYKKLGDYQPWEVLKRWLKAEEFHGYMKGTAIAYLARERDKGGLLDIKKAIHTLQALIELTGEGK